MSTYWLTSRENFRQLVPSMTEVSYINNDPDIREVRYAHMYEQTSTGRIHYRGNDDMLVQDCNE